MVEIEGRERRVERMEEPCGVISISRVTLSVWKGLTTRPVDPTIAVDAIVRRSDM
jgi:hypothetical protein